MRANPRAYSALIGQMAQSVVTGLLCSDWSDGPICCDCLTAHIALLITISEFHLKFNSNNCVVFFFLFLFCINSNASHHPLKVYANWICSAECLHSQSAILHCIKGNIRKSIIDALSGTTTCKCTNYSYINKVALHFFFKFTIQQN